MTIREAISQVDSQLTNVYTQKEKIGWLNRLDMRIKTQIIDTHEGADKEKAITEYIQANRAAHENAVIEFMKVNEVSREEAEKNVAFKAIKYKEAKEHIEAARNDIFFTGYNEDTDLETELLVPAPYDEIYLRHLEAMIHYHNQEEDRCNNATDAFNVLYWEFFNDYNRKHMPKGQKFSV